MFVNLLKNLDKVKFVDADSLISVLYDRLDTLECQEPISDGITHDNWEEKYDEFQDLTDRFEEALKNNDEETFYDLILEIQDYQLMYGGLSRLKILL